MYWPIFVDNSHAKNLQDFRIQRFTAMIFVTGVTNSQNCADFSQLETLYIDLVMTLISFFIAIKILLITNSLKFRFRLKWLWVSVEGYEYFNDDSNTDDW